MSEWKSVRERGGGVPLPGVIQWVTSRVALCTSVIMIYVIIILLVRRSCTDTFLTVLSFNQFIQIQIPFYNFLLKLIDSFRFQMSYET